MRLQDFMKMVAAMFNISPQQCLISILKEGFAPEDESLLLNNREDIKHLRLIRLVHIDDFEDGMTIFVREK